MIQNILVQDLRLFHSVTRNALPARNGDKQTKTKS